MSGRYISAGACTVHSFEFVIGELTSGSRRNKLIKSRRIVSWISVHELGYSGAEVKRHLGVTNFCVTRYIASGDKPDIEGLI